MQKEYKKANKKELRTAIFVLLSVVATLAFGIFNTAVYVMRDALWSLCIAIYYYFVFAIKITLLWHEGILKNKAERVISKRITANLVYRALFFVVDVALITPIALMALNQREVHYSDVTAIAFSAYTVYKITASALNFKKANKGDNLSAQTLRALNFKDALLSVIALQYVLIQTFGTSNALDILCQVTNLLLWLIIVGVSVLELIDVVKAKKKHECALWHD